MRRGQAALEFLTTYGWAFLVILVMIGALAYFGVLNPKALLPGRCNFSPEIDCVEYNIDGTTNPDVLSFRFRNSLGSNAAFTFNATYLGNTVVSAGCVDGPDLSDVRPGRIFEVKCEFPEETFAIGEKVKFEISGTYQKTDGIYQTPFGGEIYGDAR